MWLRCISQNTENMNTGAPIDCNQNDIYEGYVHEGYVHEGYEGYVHINYIMQVE